MEYVQAKGIAGGIAIGKISVYNKSEQTVKRMRTDDTEEEITRYEQAREKAVSELHEIYEKAVTEVGELNAQIFEVHAMMLEDGDYNDSVKNIISTQKVNAEYAVAKTGDNFAKMFEDMEEEYFRARSADVRDISERVISALKGVEYGVSHHSESVIIAAGDLAPSETIQMDKDAILAFVTETGSGNSHTAILARSMGIPAITGVKISGEWNGMTAAVNGYTGEFYLNPDEEIIERLHLQQEEEKMNRELLQKIRGRETVTKDGKKIHLYANIGDKSDVANVLSNDAEGVGLFRTEFLYLGKNQCPSEQEQFQIYKYVAETMAGKKVIIRTLDIGADKKADYLNLGQEENPAMGYRAIRICLDRKDIFQTQLRAILRAAAYGQIAVMFPMIISVEEVKQAKSMMNEVRGNLEREGIEYGTVEVGIMIETPAAVMISDELAKEVEFFSIGTNDLTQYTLAVDRQNPRLDNIYDAHHPAVLKMIEMVIKNGHAEGIWVGICGELGADISLTNTLIEMGIDELSVSPDMILPLRSTVLEAGEKKQ